MRHETRFIPDGLLRRYFFQLLRCIIYIFLWSCIIPLNSADDDGPELQLSFQNSDDITNYAPEDPSFNENRTFGWRHPIRRIGKSMYELHYIISVWTERFEQVNGWFESCVHLLSNKGRLNTTIHGRRLLQSERMCLTMTEDFRSSKTLLPLKM